MDVDAKTSKDVEKKDNDELTIENIESSVETSKEHTTDQQNNTQHAINNTQHAINNTQHAINNTLQHAINNTSQHQDTSVQHSKNDSTKTNQKTSLNNSNDHQETKLNNLPLTTATEPTQKTHSTATEPTQNSQPTPREPTNEQDMLRLKLREVFDVCDVNNQGFISVDHFLELAKEFATSDKHYDDKFIKRMVSALDTDGSGRFSFDDFCKGVKQILVSNNSVLEDGNIDQRVIQEFLTVRRQSVDCTRSPEIFETQPASPFAVDNDEINTNNNNNNNFYNNTKSPFDVVINGKTTSNSSEDDVDSGAWSAVTQDNLWSTPANRNSNFEVTPSPLSNGFPANDFLANGFNSNVLLDTGDYDEKPVNHFHRKVHSNNTTPRSSFRSTPGSRNGSFRRNLTPSSIANHSFKSGSAMNCSDLLVDADSQVSELSDKILKLEDDLSSLNQIQKQNEDKQLKMKEENALMVERIHMLEDHLREIETTNQERLREEQNKYKEILMKTEKDKANQIELLSRSLKLVELEYNTLKEASPLLKSENEKLRKENSSLERELGRLRGEYADLSDEKDNIEKSFASEQEKMKKEREARSQLLDDLTQELNELRICKSNLMKSPGCVKRSESDLDLKHNQEKVKHLKKENSELKNQLEELQAVILSRGVEEGQRLIQQTSPFEKSLASEIDEIPKNELVEALKKEQEANSQLKEYIGFITLRILEKNPSILEINKLQDDKK